MTTTSNPIDLLDEFIADLEAQLNLAPGAPIPTVKAAAGPPSKDSGKSNNVKKENVKKQSKEIKKSKKKQVAKKAQVAPTDQPEICKLEFKVGLITKVWNHPDADKLYCEEIDVGEESGPRQIASGLRPYYTLDQMMGQRLLVVSNLKPKNLVGFKSFGMVLCASTEGGVEFVEPPDGAEIGEVVTFEGLPKPIPMSGSQVEKKKVFQKAMEGMKTNADCVAEWDGHVFMTSAGPCRSKTIANAPMR